MATQTEKLLDIIESIICQVDALHDISYSDAAVLILRACKEAELKFVETIKDDSTQYNTPDNAGRIEIQEIEVDPSP